MKILFLDESGDHSLDKIDSEYPVFVLGGVIVDAEYANGELTDRLKQFKLDLFGHDELVLHTADIARVRKGFERLTDTTFRQKFYDRLNELMQSLEYTVVACAIKKDEHLMRYGLNALDPYLLSLNVLIERFCFDITDADAGQIIAERRSPMLDNELELAWLNLKISGTQYLVGSDIQKRIGQLTLRDKKANIAGLQLADLVISPIGRYVIGKQPMKDWLIIESKFRRQPGHSDYLGSGLIILPKK